MFGLGAVLANASSGRAPFGDGSLVGLLARRVFSASVAARAMVLFAVFPGSFVLSFAYSEAPFIVFAASCLLLLLDEQWLLAGLAAALATATRPNGVAIVFDAAGNAIGASNVDRLTVQ